MGWQWCSSSRSVGGLRTPDSCIMCDLLRDTDASLNVVIDFLCPLRIFRLALIHFVTPHFTSPDFTPLHHTIHYTTLSHPTSLHRTLLHVPSPLRFLVALWTWPQEWRTRWRPWLWLRLCRSSQTPLNRDEVGEGRCYWRGEETRRATQDGISR
jgi:hypothetical protein